MTRPVRDLPHPADFPAPPNAPDRIRWAAADAAARPARLARLRARLAADGVDAYFGIRPEHMRYLTGFALDDGEDRVAGNSGRFVVSGDEVVVLADSRYRLQARAQATGARIEATTHDLAAIWPELMKSLGARRVAVESALVSHELWRQLESAAPRVELVEASGWVEAQRAIKEPAEIERIRAACAVADRSLAALLRRIKPGQTERELALALEWEMRTGGADSLAFGIACLAGPNAALPHGSPSASEARLGQVLLFDFGALVDGYRSDMTRTLFVGEPTQRDLDVYRIVAAAQTAALDLLRTALSGGAAEPAPSGLAVDAAARGVIDDAGHGEHFGHGTGHGIGLATHELPSLSRVAPDDPLPSPTVFSVEPGIYLDGETGVRIEDLVVFDRSVGDLELLTGFPRDVLAVGV
ncbi:MAG: Xaa-Pro peptidase family protein [Candidatus Limnocylindrales bacterium]|jgi:Xaa-Pro aminopeptidase